MKLANDFFKILSVEQMESKYHIGIELNPDHEIFKGHFPGNPVVPGVCMVQMIKEILQSLFDQEYTMKAASQLKFLAIINPEQIKMLDVELNISKKDPGGLEVSGTFHKNDLVFLKYKAAFTS